jgi:hypothetical protein
MGLFDKKPVPESDDPERPPKGPASVSRKREDQDKETPEVRITTTYEIWGTR